MLDETRKRLEDAMVASALENLHNADPEESMEEFIEHALRNGTKGFDAMDSAELLQTAIDESGYDVGVDFEPARPEDGTTELMKLWRAIHVARADRWSTGDSMQIQLLRAHGDPIESSAIVAHVLYDQHGVLTVIVSVGGEHRTRALALQDDGLWRDDISDSTWRIKE